MRLVCLILAILFSSTMANAQNLAWMNPEQMTLLGRLGNGFSAIRNCNFGVGDEVLARELTHAYKQSLDGAKVADLMIVVVGFSLVADELIFSGNRQAKAKKCAEMIALFGPNGTAIKGLLQDKRK
jgi:hypothetical protein